MQKGSMQQLPSELSFMSSWQSMYTTIGKSLVLGNYIINGKEPNSNLLSSEDFAHARNYVANKLRSYSYSKDIIHKFMDELANILDDVVKVDDEFLEKFPSMEEVADILNHFVYVWA